MNGESVRYDIWAAAAAAVLLTILAPFLFFYFQRVNHDNIVLSEVSQLRSALEINYIVTAHYPIETAQVPLNDANSSTQRLCYNGFTSYAEPCDKVIIGMIQNTYPEEPYLYMSSDDGLDYQIRFLLENNHRSLGLTKGVQCAGSQGISSGECPGF